MKMYEESNPKQFSSPPSPGSVPETEPLSVLAAVQAPMSGLRARCPMWGLDILIPYSVATH